MWGAFKQGVRLAARKGRSAWWLVFGLEPPTGDVLWLASVEAFDVRWGDVQWQQQTLERSPLGKMGQMKNIKGWGRTWLELLGPWVASSIDGRRGAFRRSESLWCPEAVRHLPPTFNWVLCPMQHPGVLSILCLLFPTQALGGGK